MGYRNKTYVIFDGDRDKWAYGYMKGWKSNENCDFDFHDAHGLAELGPNAQSEDYIKKALRERFRSAKQVIVLVGESTKDLYRFVRWEMDVALSLELPVVAVNLNGKRMLDSELCPPIIRDTYTVHVAYKMAIIQHALDQFPSEFSKQPAGSKGPRYYNDGVYKQLGL